MILSVVKNHFTLSNCVHISVAMEIHYLTVEHSPNAAVDTILSFLKKSSQRRKYSALDSLKILVVTVRWFILSICFTIVSWFLVFKASLSAVPVVLYCSLQDPQ